MGDGVDTHGAPLQLQGQLLAGYGQSHAGGSHTNVEGGVKIVEPDAVLTTAGDGGGHIAGDHRANGEVLISPQRITPLSGFGKGGPDRLYNVGTNMIL